MGKDMQVSSQTQTMDVAIHDCGLNPLSTRTPKRIISSGTNKQVCVRCQFSILDSFNFIALINLKPKHLFCCDIYRFSPIKTSGTDDMM